LSVLVDNIASSNNVDVTLLLSFACAKKDGNDACVLQR